MVGNQTVSFDSDRRSQISSAASSLQNYFPFIRESNR